MWGIFLANAYGLGLAAALIAVTAHVILRTPELLLVAYSWLKVEKMDERPRETKSGQRSLHRPHWEPDTVYLVQWPVSPNVRSISPFALKLESWLRMNKIKYENVYSMILGSKGQTPYVELNGKEITNSNLIVEKLGKHFGDCDDGVLTPEQGASARAITIMLENHTCTAGFLWRYGYNMRKFVEATCRGILPQKFLERWCSINPYIVRLRGHFHGLGRNYIEDVEEMLNRDLKALSILLGDNAFFFGATPHALDCTVFAHLAQFLYIPIGFPQESFLAAECQNLVQFCERVKRRFWPDWDALCRKECMKGHFGLDKTSLDWKSAES